MLNNYTQLKKIMQALFCPNLQIRAFMTDKYSLIWVYLLDFCQYAQKTKASKHVYCCIYIDNLLKLAYQAA